ncbi:hypothetical protein F4X10_19280 [Candidatus Poribacteria bacterium]|nr:hypothetical protein [Candidatus Poribacteria bacterium]
MIRIAHRGASGIAPENTLAAFEKALDIGVDAVELDLHGTADGEVVVIHDASLDRTTNHYGRVNQTTLETIKRADAGGWFAPEFVGESVPTLVEALECITKKTIAVLEIKDPLIAEAVVARIHGTQTQDLTVIISFHTPVLETVRALEPRIPTGWIIGTDNNHASPVQLCQQLGELGSNLLDVNHQLITAEFAYEIQRRGIALWCWTVDDISRMREMKAFGVQGITSNHPEHFVKV